MTSQEATIRHVLIRRHHPRVHHAQLPRRQPPHDYVVVGAVWIFAGRLCGERTNVVVFTSGPSIPTCPAKVDDAGLRYFDHRVLRQHRW